MTAAAPRRAVADTSVLIDFSAEQVAGVADELAVSAISLAELLFGVTATTDGIEQLARRRRVQLISEMYEVLVFDGEVAEFYGALAGAVRGAGRNPGPRRMDLQIAATAARHGLDVVTRNGADFAGLSAMVRARPGPELLMPARTWARRQGLEPRVRWRGFTTASVAGGRRSYWSRLVPVPLDHQP